MACILSRYVSRILYWKFYLKYLIFSGIFEAVIIMVNGSIVSDFLANFLCDCFLQFFRQFFPSMFSFIFFFNFFQSFKRNFFQLVGRHLFFCIENFGWKFSQLSCVWTLNGVFLIKICSNLMKLLWIRQKNFGEKSLTFFKWNSIFFCKQISIIIKVQLAPTDDTLSVIAYLRNSVYFRRAPSKSVLTWIFWYHRFHIEC